MRKGILFTLVIVLCFALAAGAADEKPADTADAKKAAPEKKMTLGEQLIGEWIIAPHDGILSGDITFKSDGTYEKNEKHKDGTGVGAKGQYILYPDQKPCGIDICLDKCGKPGSEWTTLFGIVRTLEDGQVEIRTSPSEKRPTEFAKEEDDYTMILTRKPAEKE